MENTGLEFKIFWSVNNDLTPPPTFGERERERKREKERERETVRVRERESERERVT